MRPRPLDGQPVAMRSLAAACLLLIACGSDPAPDATKGEMCDAIGDRWCFRGANACSLGGTYDECFQGFKKSCCLDGGTCQNRWSTAADFSSYVKECGGAIDAATCESVSKATLPAACLKGVF